MQTPQFPRTTSLFIIFALSIFFISNDPASAKSFNQETQDTVKKIVMMLNIAAKEFADGVVDGKIVIPPEYKESQVFLQQASERYSRVSKKIEDQAKAKVLSQHFSELKQMVKTKVASQKIWDKVNQVNSQLMSTFKIEINKLPITPVSLSNGKKIFETNCAVCHGIAGHGDGPIAKQFDPPPLPFYLTRN